MLTITDTTLCSPQIENAKASQVIEFYQAILQLGVDYIQITPKILALLGDSLDPDRTLLQINGTAGQYDGYDLAGTVCGQHDTTVKGKITREIAVSAEGTMPTVSLDGMEKARLMVPSGLFLRDYASLFEQWSKTLPSDTEICAQNAGIAATALTVDWVLLGGKNIVVSLMGAGGNAPMEEVVMALRTSGHPVEAIDVERFTAIAKLWQWITGQTIRAHKPIVGQRIFHVESGVHVDGIFKNGKNYEPFSPEDVGGKRKILLGKHSGKSSIIMKLREMEMCTDSHNISALLDAVRLRGIAMGRSLTDLEFYQLVHQVEGSGML